MAEYSAQAESADPASSLSLYRAALRLRRELESAEQLDWIGTGRADVLRFARPGGWEVVTNFGTSPYALGPDAEDVVLASGPVEGGFLPGEATAWLRRR
jgi:alpha-glucosidase